MLLRSEPISLRDRPLGRSGRNSEPECDSQNEADQERQHLPQGWYSNIPRPYRWLSILLPRCDRASKRKQSPEPEEHRKEEREPGEDCGHSVKQTCVRQEVAAEGCREGNDG